MNGEGRNTPDTDYTTYESNKSINSNLTTALEATYEFTLEESIGFLKPLIRDSSSSRFDSEPVALGTPKAIAGRDIKGLQYEIIKDLRLTEPYSKRANLFLGRIQKTQGEELRKSADYAKAYLLARHVHNYIKHIY